MKKIVVFVFVFLFLLTGFVRPVFALYSQGEVCQEFSTNAIQHSVIDRGRGIVYAAEKNLEILEVIGIVEETPRLDSGQATESAEATSSGTIKLEEAKKEDITERESPVKSKLEGYLSEKDPGPLSWKNFLQWGIRQAVDQGVSPNTIVLVLLFPLVAGLIAAARHLFGLTGFGIFVPAMLSVAMVATGVRVGLILFTIILAVATLARGVTKKLKMQYLPRMALLMWFVSVGVLAVLLGAVNIQQGELSAVSIFPILILMLLAENFIEVQVGKSRREATRVTLQTLLMAVVAALVMRVDLVQKWVLLNPELVLLLVVVFDVYVGKYVGLRFLENLKFKSIVKK